MGSDVQQRRTEWCTFRRSTAIFALMCLVAQACGLSFVRPIGTSKPTKLSTGYGILRMLQRLRVTQLDRSSTRYQRCHNSQQLSHRREQSMSTLFSGSKDDMSFNPKAQLNLNNTSSSSLDSSLLDAIASGGAKRAAREWSAYMDGLGHNSQPSRQYALWFLALCAVKADWKRAHMLYHDLCARGVEVGVEGRSALACAHARGGYPEEAEELCYRMIKDGLKPNARSFTPVLAAYASSHRWQKALEVLRRMEKEDITPSVINFDAILGGMADARAWRSGVALLEEMEHRALVMSSPLSSSKDECNVSTDGKYPSLESFSSESCKSMTFPSNFSYSIVARMYANKFDWRGGLSILERLYERTLQVDKVTYTGVIQSCGMRGQWKLANRVFRTYFDRLNGTKPDVLVCGAALKAMCVSKQWEMALRYTEWFCNISGILESDRDRDSRDDVDSNHGDSINDETIVHQGPNQIMFNTALDAVARYGPPKAVLHVLQLMQEKGVERSTVTYNTLLNAFASQNKWQKAEQVILAMSRSQVTADIYTYNSIMKGYRIGKQPYKALRLLDYMLQKNPGWGRRWEWRDEDPADIDMHNTNISFWGALNVMPPDAYTFAEVIKACVSAGWPRLGLRVFDAGILSSTSEYESGHDRLVVTKEHSTSRNITLVHNNSAANIRGSIEPTMVVIGAALDCCAKVGDWAKALRILDRAQKAKIRSSVVTATAVVSACSKGSQWRKALDLIDMFEKSGVKLNEVTYHSLLAGLGRPKSLPWSYGFEILNKMYQKHLRPDERTWHILLAGFSRARQWHSVLEVARRMRSRSIPLREGMRYMYDSARKETRGGGVHRSRGASRPNLNRAENSDVCPQMGRSRMSCNSSRGRKKNEDRQKT